MKLKERYIIGNSHKFTPANPLLYNDDENDDDDDDDNNNYNNNNNGLDIQWD